MASLPGPFALGAANLGNLYAPMSDEQAHAVLEAAWDSGIRYFDTAPHYGLGLSERRLGAFLAGKPRAEFVVSTKAGRLLVPDPAGAGRLDEANQFAVPADHRRVWDFSADGVRRSLDDSLTRLGLDSVDVVYLHDPEEYDLDPALASGLPALAGLRDEGVVRAVGVGSKSVAALAAAARSGIADLLMVAGRFTLLDHAALDEVLPECRARSIGVAAASVFNSGLLATPEPAGRYDYAAAPPDVLVTAREIAAVCAEFGVDLPTAALHFPLRDPAVRAVVAGAATPEEVRQNARRLAATVPAELWTTLRDKGLIRA
ncbi:aldo/keto reductase [Amycolatopsis ruanii]|uniref:aldo/keto reductase n=1 Tax=Amycolatopsis ruanii TaxID=944491 RepID=UPI000E243E84|nr:aldo/keto reductase [Amycolatopsis ruanii]